MNTIRLAYLVSQHPAISMSFIVREVQALRRLGFEISVVSINLPDRPVNQLTAEEREEVGHTFYLKPAGFRGAIKAQLATLFTHPLRYLRGLWFAIRLGQLDLTKILYNGFYFVEAVMVGHWMQQQSLTHVHIHIPMAAATVGLIAKQTFPITVSMTIHGPNEFYDIPGQFLPQKILAAEFICCISHFARSQLMAWSPPEHWSKLELNRLGVDPCIFVPAPFREHPHPFEVLCVGRLVPVKGQFILIEAIIQLLQQNRQVRLRLIGDGPDRPQLQTYIQQHQLSERVILEGAVNQEQILKYYQQTDVFAIASFAEGIPVVLMEAMAMAIPCVSTHITGIPELISKDEGILVAPADVTALTKALALLMDQPQLRYQLGQAARQKILQNYHLPKNTQQLANIFRGRLSRLK